MQHRERLREVADRMRRGYTPEEIADSVRRPLRTVKDDIQQVQALHLDHFRRQRAKERAHTFEVCQRTQASLWKLIEGCVDSKDRKAVPAAARALLETIRTGEALRNADEKDVEQGQLTVRDIYAQLGADYLNEPVALVEAEAASARPAPDAAGHDETPQAED